MTFNNPLCCGFVKTTIYQYQVENDLTQNDQISKLRELFSNLKFFECNLQKPFKINQSIFKT